MSKLCSKYYILDTISGFLVSLHCDTFHCVLCLYYKLRRTNIMTKEINTVSMVNIWFVPQCGKMKSFLSPEKNFVKSTTPILRYLVISLVKVSLSRKFCQKSISTLCVPYYLHDFGQLPIRFFLLLLSFFVEP